MADGLAILHRRWQRRREQWRRQMRARRSRRARRAKYLSPGVGRVQVGFKDGSGRQRWRTVDGGITAARAVRDELLVRRSRGERVASNARLRFTDAAAQWLAGPVVDLRAATQACYRNAVEQHLMQRFAMHRLDMISPDDLAALVRDLRADGLAESTIVIVVGVVNRIYRYAARRLGWAGTNPVSLLLPSERPKPGQSAKRRLFERDARANDRRGGRAVRHALHAGGAYRCSRLRVAGTQMGKRPDLGSGGRRGGVRVPGRPSRQRSADQDGRIGPNRADPG